MRRSLENPLWGVPGFVNFIDSRTKWFDGAVSDALRSGVTQVVILAAGFDTRPYRFASPGVSFYEVDLPAASARKRALVDKLGLLAEQPAAERHPPPTFVAADLSVTDLEQALAESPATAAGARRFDPSQRTLFTAEGLLYYLPPAAVHALLASVSRCAAPGSALYFDFMNRDALEGRRAYPSFSTVAKVSRWRGARGHGRESSD